MYFLHDYGNMLANRERFDSYRKAIADAVRSGDAVLDLGCGPGVFALLACRGGARKVYAIESEEIVHHARDLAAANGYADRIEFIHDNSRKVTLPERVNVIVSDVRGNLPFYDKAIASIEDARQRFLRPGGIIIPGRDILKVAIVDVAGYYSKLTSPWLASYSGFDLSRSLELILNSSYTAHFKNEQLITESRTWCVLDYTAGAAVNGAADLCFKTTRAGTAHGICVWFETELTDTIGFSTAPSERRDVYGQRFFPWPQTISFAKGQEIQIRLRADLVGDEYIWRWETQICADAKNSVRCFKQSTFQGANFTPEGLRRRAADYVPTLSEEGRADRWLLQAMDGRTSLQQMAQEAARQFPTIFSRWEDALRRAADLAAQFSR